MQRRATTPVAPANGHTTSPSTPDPSTAPPKTIPYSALPPWAQDNPAILSGYRQPDLKSYSYCFKSIFGWFHNESVNILSHLGGSLISLVCGGASLLLGFASSGGGGGEQLRRLGWRAPFSLVYPWPNPSQPSVTWVDTTVFGIFFLSAATCLGLSATFHTLNAHSMAVSHKWNQLDYVGIAILISGTFIPMVRYGWFCSQGLVWFYWGLITLAAGCTIAATVTTHGNPAMRRRRTYFFIALGASAVFPISHSIIKYGFANAAEAFSLNYLGLGGLLYILGALLYAERCPESLSPGSFDLIGSSHQIFHILILLAAWSHFTAICESFRFFHGEMGGICRGAFI